MSWRLSLSMDAEFCVEALKEAISNYGTPALFDTDQGRLHVRAAAFSCDQHSQCTSYGFIQILKKTNVEISMDGQGRWRDNIYVERFWRSLTYEDIYLKSYESVCDLKRGPHRYFTFYNSRRFHQSNDYRTPDEMYQSFQVQEEEAAA